MKLLELQPRWVPKGSDIQSAIGIVFLCPLCFKKNGGPSGTHSIKIHFFGRTDEALNFWIPRGSDFSDLTIVGSPAGGGHPSILLIGERCGAHFEIRQGEIVPS
jgi:hypothetical protein